MHRALDVMISTEERGKEEVREKEEDGGRREGGRSETERREGERGEGRSRELTYCAEESHLICLLNTLGCPWWCVGVALFS